PLIKSTTSIDFFLNNINIKDFFLLFGIAFQEIGVYHPRTAKYRLLVVIGNLNVLYRLMQPFRLGKYRFFIARDILKQIDAVKWSTLAGYDQIHIPIVIIIDRQRPCP